MNVGPSFLPGDTPLWFKDLTPCTYFPVAAPLIAVGWLERGKPYTTGVTHRTVYEALIEMRKNPWQPFLSGGLHECDLCQFTPEARGSANLFIPHNGKIYAAPELIVHYINAHSYAPPEDFCRAVLACPPMRSMDYLKALKACGGAKLIQPFPP